MQIPIILTLFINMFCLYIIISGLNNKIYFKKYKINKKYIVNNKINNMVKTSFPEEYNDETNKNKKIIKELLLNKLEIENQEYHNKPLYTVIWYDCDQCRILLEDMEKLNLKKIYLNYDTTVDSEFTKPLLYKDDEFIGDNLFDIYKEIYSS